MSKTFNEWTEEAYKTELVLVAEDGWNARQGEIDELLLVGNNLLDRIQELCLERDELQKQIDEALKFYNEAKSQHNIGMIHMALLLKGNKQ